ncbi:MAG: RHS repeat-associated core domain-containing protein [Planctomycetota bacterium]
MNRLMIWVVLAVAAFASDAMAVYDASTGRWMQRDPIGYVDGMNLYAYVGSAPVKYIDSSGKAAHAPGGGRPNPEPLPRPYRHRIIVIHPDDANDIRPPNRLSFDNAHDVCILEDLNDLPGELDSLSYPGGTPLISISLVTASLGINIMVTMAY